MDESMAQKGSVYKPQEQTVESKCSFLLFFFFLLQHPSRNTPIFFPIPNFETNQRRDKQIHGLIIWLTGIRLNASDISLKFHDHQACTRLQIGQRNKQTKKASASKANTDLLNSHQISCKTYNAISKTKTASTHKTKTASQHIYANSDVRVQVNSSAYFEQAV